MSSNNHLISDLVHKGLINPPRYVDTGLQYLTLMGSMAYGVANTTDSDDTSDWDVYGFCIPYLNIVFPHIGGEIFGFGQQIQRFEQFQAHHIRDTSNKREYDLSIYNIVKYFQLVMENNPNMIDSLFTLQRCVLYCTPIGNLVRENRRAFLHRGCWGKFKGYAYSQINKLKNKAILKYVKICEDLEISVDTTPNEVEQEIQLRSMNGTEGTATLSLAHLSNNQLLELVRIQKQCYQGGKVSKRLHSIKKHGYDPKFAYHVVRLLNEVEQILIEHDLDLEKSREQLKSIRRGEWSIGDIESFFDKKERELETVYTNSTLPYSPDEPVLKKLLLKCLEAHFGTVEKYVKSTRGTQDLINGVQSVLDKHRG